MDEAMGCTFNLYGATLEVVAVGMTTTGSGFSVCFGLPSSKVRSAEALLVED